MKINFVTFSNKKWDIGCSKRIRNSCVLLNEFDPLFNSYHIYNEDDLDNNYQKDFGKYVCDRGYAQWTWKSYFILKEFNNIDYNDYVLYLDSGCVFPDNDSIEFKSNLRKLCNEMNNNNCYISLTNGYCPNIWIVNKDILSKFNLLEDNFFLRKYQHWQAGLILIKKTHESIKLILDWYNFQRDNYEGCIHRCFDDKTNQFPEYKHNGSDQAILQCLLYTNKIKVNNMNWLFMSKYKIIQRKNN